MMFTQALCEVGTWMGSVKGRRGGRVEGAGCYRPPPTRPTADLAGKMSTLLSASLSL